jgi:hypothetical protein
MWPIQVESRMQKGKKYIWEVCGLENLSHICTLPILSHSLSFSLLCDLWSPLPAGFWLDLDNRRHHQKSGRVFISLLPPRWLLQPVPKATVPIWEHPVTHMWLFLHVWQAIPLLVPLDPGVVMSS